MVSRASRIATILFPWLPRMANKNFRCCRGMPPDNGMPISGVPLYAGESTPVVGSLAVYDSLDSAALVNRLTKIDHHPRLQTLLKTRALKRSFTWLAMFGGETAKPVKLFSDDGFILHLYRKLDRKSLRGKVKQTVRRFWKGRKECYTGVPAAMKASQVYPPRFGTQAPRGRAWGCYVGFDRIKGL